MSSLFWELYRDLEGPDFPSPPNEIACTMMAKDRHQVAREFLRTQLRTFVGRLDAQPQEISDTCAKMLGNLAKNGILPAPCEYRLEAHRRLATWEDLYPHRGGRLRARLALWLHAKGWFKPGKTWRWYHGLLGFRKARLGILCGRMGDIVKGAYDKDLYYTDPGAQAERIADAVLGFLNGGNYRVEFQAILPAEPKPALVLTLWINISESLRGRRAPMTFVVSDEVLAPT